MVLKTAKTTARSQKKLQPLQRFSLFFFHRPRTTALLAIVFILFGILSYTTLLKREGFPSINTPFAMTQGTYFVNDPAKVDKDVAGPLTAFLLKQSGVKTVTAQSYANFYTVIVSYNDSVNSVSRSAELQKEVVADNILPSKATVKIDAFKFGFTQRGDDAVVSFIDTSGTASLEQLTAQAQSAASYFKSQHLSLVKDVSIINPFETATDLNGAVQTQQKSFERYGDLSGGTPHFYAAVVIGFTAQKGVDNVKLNNQIQTALTTYNQHVQSQGYEGRISASYAPQIKQQIGELQKTLLEGLLAVLVVGSIVIAIRASLITVLAMITVITTTIGVLYLLGYTLNTITLFALILGLSLIVDDTIIMVEALDAQRRRRTDQNDIVGTAVGRVGRAMIAATSTAALSFAPLLFVGGILGGFIRAIPVTIITALAISLVLALTVIPFYARFILLRPKQLGPKHGHEPAAGIEARIARGIAAPMLWAQHSKRKLAFVGLTAVVISIGFIVAAGLIFGKVTFNIFPPSKDTNQLATTLTFPSGTTITQAQEVTDAADKLVAKTLGANFVQAANLGSADAQSAQLTINLTDYNARSETAPQMVKDLKAAFVGFQGASFAANTIDVGPPGSTFTVQIDAGANRPASQRLAEAVASYVRADKLQRTNGTTVKIDTVTVANSDVYTRTGNKLFIGVTTTFGDTDTTTIVDLAKNAVKKEFTADKIRSFGLDPSVVSYDAGQEDSNQNSFKTMAYAFPVLLLVIYILLAFQFKSVLQPLLIFMAIPFSLFGITLGLYLTNNAFSFFALLGFFALIGLSLKNTILLVDYANQSRRAGMNPVDAAHEALAERFRPLIATSFTAVFSLIPLALSSPFWQGLAVVLIFGLLSSTFLVIMIFPYYYLAGEFLRGIGRRRVAAPIKRRLKRG